MIMACKAIRACKASTVIERTIDSGADEPDVYVLRQEWHGVFEDALFLDSEFAKLCEASEGVTATLVKWTSVQF
jgi:hypothetical protein